MSSRPSTKQRHVISMLTANKPRITFVISVDEIDGGYSASALEYGIHTQADPLDELRCNIREAVDCYFDHGEVIPIAQCVLDTSTRP